MNSRLHRLHNASPLRRHTSRAIAILALLFWGVCPTFLFAQVQNQPSQSSNQPSEDRKEDSVEQLKRKVEQIQKQYQKDLSELQERLGSVEKRQSSLSDEIAQHVKLGGYGLVVFEDFRDRKTTYAGKMELLISGQFHDRIRFYSEIDLGVPHGTSEVEQGYVDLLLTQAFNFRAGVLLTPFGKFNLDHFDPRQDLTDRPVVARRITPTTWSDLGVGAFGLVPLGDAVKATYEIQVINGLTDKFTAASQGGTLGSSTGGVVAQDIGLRDARTGLRTDNNGNKAVVGRGTLKFLDQYEVGFSGYRGAYKETSNDQIVGTSLDAEFRPRGVPFWEDFVFKAEYARFDIENSSAPSSLWGYYAQLNYRFWPAFLNSTVMGRHFSNPALTLVGRYGYARINTTAVSDGKLTENTTVIGLNYRPVQDYVIKVEYQFNSGQLERKSMDGFLASVSWLF
jgi:hypothetical protein